MLDEKEKEELEKKTHFYMEKEPPSLEEIISDLKIVFFNVNLATNGEGRAGNLDADED
jgi:hypothetical protein